MMIGLFIQIKPIYFLLHYSCLDVKQKTISGSVILVAKKQQNVECSRCILLHTWLTRRDCDK